jgi:hypothetical protein
MNVHPYPLDIKLATIKDVSESVQHHLGEIYKEDGFSGAYWPGNDKNNALSNGAGGLFIWALTTCLYIKSHDPN